jgi:hypothetical protein
MKLSVALSLTCIGLAAAFVPTLQQHGQRQSNFALDMARKPFISGNWKLNPKTKTEAVKLAADIAAAVTSKSPDADVALFVPYPFIESVKACAGEKLIVGAEVRYMSKALPVSVLDAYYWFDKVIVTILLVTLLLEFSPANLAIGLQSRLASQRTLELSPVVFRPVCSSRLV